MVLTIPVAASAATTHRPLAATFNPIGDGPNVEWLSNPASHFNGTVQSIDSHGAANALLNFDIDPELDALGDLEVVMRVSGYYRSFLNRHELSLSFDFFYAGVNAITVGGVDYAAGTRLLSFSMGAHQPYDLNTPYGFGLGPFAGYGFTSEMAGTSLYSLMTFGTLSSDAYPTELPDPGYHGRKYIVPGQATWSGSVYGHYVPEPSTWALLIVGFGAAGAMLRRRSITLA